MRSSALLLMVASSLVLANCATSQSNPIYQQSTKYKATNPYAGNTAIVQQASMQTQDAVPVRYVTQTNNACLSKESNHKIIGTLAGGAIGALAGRKLGGDNKTLGTIAGAGVGGAVGYGIADKSIRCDPVGVVQNPATQVITPNSDIYQASTPQTTHQNFGENTQVITPSIEENTASLGDAGTPGYYAVQNAENTPAPIEAQLTIPTITPEPAIIAPASINIRRHMVVSGDTVYSLARTSCVSVAELKQVNNINDEFYIRVGEEITLPPSHCVE